MYWQKVFWVFVWRIFATFPSEELCELKYSHVIGQILDMVEQNQKTLIEIIIGLQGKDVKTYWYIFWVRFLRSQTEKSVP